MKKKNYLTNEILSQIPIVIADSTFIPANNLIFYVVASSNHEFVRSRLYRWTLNIAFNLLNIQLL